jgi:hypothetical protein
MEGKSSMSTNDDSASRRGRRADQAEPDWRAASRSGNQYPGQTPRDSQPQNAAYSGFTRQSYSQQQPPAPASPQPGRAFDAPQGYYQDPAPQPPQGYYQDPAPQAPQQSYYQDPAPRGYVDPASAYAPPSPYDSNPQHMPYGGAGGELFGRDPAAPQSFDQGPYGANSGYRPDSFEPAQQRAPLMPPREEERYVPRAAPEPSAPRYYPEEQPQRSAPPLAAPPALDRGYAPPPPQQQLYSPASYDQPPVVHESYQRGGYDSQFPAGEIPFDDDEMRTGRPPMTAAHSDDFDEEFPDEDFDNEDYGVPQKRGRKKLFAALLLSAAAVVVGGGYGYKTFVAGKHGGSTPYISAERTPAKEVPANPGGKQFPHGEKSIYDRLDASGRTQVASAPVATAAAVSPGFTSSASGANGSSLEDRIDEALKRAQGAGDAPSAAPGRGGDQPTVVRSESYRPDGTRVDSRPVITPNIANADNGLPYPFGNAPSAAPAAQQQAASFRPAPMQPQFATATAAAPAPTRGAPARMAAHTPPPAPLETSTAAAVPAPAGSFYVSLKSAPDEKAIQRDVPALTQKYNSVLGDVQITTKIADLGAKGVTYRAVAGPLGTKQEAMDLCTKIKGVGGDKACFVTN